MSRYQHPPTETLLQPLDHVISARVAEIRQAYRDAAGSRTFPDLNTLWTAALADVRAALDIIDPPVAECVGNSMNCGRPLPCPDHP